jgi:hypothetical protein
VSSDHVSSAKSDWKSEANAGWEPAEAPDTDYHHKWIAYRIRRGIALFLLCTWVPVCAGLFLYSRFGWHQPLLALSIMGVWLLAALFAVWWQGEFRCPRCRRRYGALGHKKGDVNWTRGMFDKVCSNCKLRKFEQT